MSRKAKRRISSLSYSLNRVYRRISTAKPSALLLSAVVISLAIFLFGGGLYNLIRRPLPSAYAGGRFLFLFPQLSEQFVTDSMVATILYSLGIIGAISIYQSTKYAYKPRQAYLMFLMGVALLLIAYVFLEAAIQIKLSQ
ncbi:hypothetical protein GTO27_09675 [Candidatus Bathyarchaeota archaeon]|nr:hypothetical protein [Candidatus Bathyarchaeota archaeon]